MSVKKLIIGSLIAGGLFSASFALAAPTSTVVQNLFITALSSTPTSSLVIGANGLVSTSTLGGGGSGSGNLFVNPSSSVLANYFPFYTTNGSTTVSATSSIYQSGTNIGLNTTNPQNLFDSAAGAHDIQLNSTTTVSTLNQTTSIALGGLPTSTQFFFEVAASDGVGQTPPGPEVSTTTSASATSSIIVTYPTIPNALSYRIYWATSSNAEAKYFLSTSATTFNFTTTTAAIAGATSSINTAYGVYLSSATSSYITGAFVVGSSTNTQSAGAPFTVNLGANWASISNTANPVLTLSAGAQGNTTITQGNGLVTTINNSGGCYQFTHGGAENLGLCGTNGVAQIRLGNNGTSAQYDTFITRITTSTFGFGSTGGGTNDSIYAGNFQSQLTSTTTVPTLATSTAGSGTLATGTTYFFQVAATDFIGQTTPTNEASITTPTAATTSINLTYQTIPNALGYRIYYSTSSNKEANYFISTAPTSYSFNTTTAAIAGATTTLTNAYSINMSSTGSSYIAGNFAIGTSTTGGIGGLYVQTTSTFNTNAFVKNLAVTCTPGNGTPTAIFPFFMNGCTANADLLMRSRTVGGVNMAEIMGTNDAANAYGNLAIDGNYVIVGGQGGPGFVGIGNSFNTLPVNGFDASTTAADFRGELSVGTTTTSTAYTLNVNGGIIVTGSSTVVTPTIGGAIVSGGCDSATTTIDSSFTSSTTAFITTAQNNPNQTLGGTWAYSILTSPGLITTYVCANITLTPNSTPYVIKIIR